MTVERIIIFGSGQVKSFTETCLQRYSSLLTYLLTYLLIYLLTYLLTPWRRAPFEKLPGSVASQEIPRIFGTRRFHTVPKSARHPSLS
jgi:hypothetical protein